MKAHLLALLLAPLCSYSQEVFWTEDFGTGCDSGLVATSYSHPISGSWTESVFNFNGSFSNLAYVSAKENGNPEGACSSGCGNDRTLHFGKSVNNGGDNGANYANSYTDRRIQSPVIDCSQRMNITLQFLMLHGGNSIDKASLWYDSGFSTWELLQDLPQTANNCSVFDTWTSFSINLPESANQNPHVRFAIRWKNDYSTNTAISFAMDDISLSGDLQVEDITPPVFACPANSSCYYWTNEYCNPQFTYGGNGCSDADYIDDLIITNAVTNYAVMGNVGSGCGGGANGYNFYSNPINGITSGVLIPGYTYTMYFASASIIFYEGFGAWMDYNNDGDFEDPNEFLGSHAPAVTFTFNFTVPEGIPDGFIRMRVISAFTHTLTSDDYCYSATFGETEDYMMNIYTPTQEAYCAQVPNFLNLMQCNYSIYDNLDPDPDYSQEPLPGNIMGSTENITITVTDSSGNSTNCNFDYVYNDIWPPYINCADDIIVSADTNSCFATITPEELGFPVSSDGCSEVTITNNHPSSIYPIGNTTVLWLSTDSSGNQNFCQQTVTVMDQTPPSIICPQDINITSDCSVVLSTIDLGNVVASDNCITTTITNNFIPGSYVLGDYEVLYTAIDSHNNANSCVQQIHIVDLLPLGLTCPQDTIITIDSSIDAIYLEIALPLITGNCDAGILLNNYNFSSSASDYYSAGQYVIVFTIEADLQTASCTSSITINENFVCCPEDFNCDGYISILDMQILLSDFGCVGDCAADLNDDGIVGVVDLQLFNGVFGLYCNSQ